MVKDGWVYCPVCHNKTRTKIRPDTVARNLPVFCPKCKTVTITDLPAHEKENYEVVNQLLMDIEKMDERTLRLVLSEILESLKDINADLEFINVPNVVMEVETKQGVSVTKYSYGEIKPNCRIVF